MSVVSEKIASSLLTLVQTNPNMDSGVKNYLRNAVVRSLKLVVEEVFGRLPPRDYIGKNREDSLDLVEPTMEKKAVRIRPWE